MFFIAKSKLLQELSQVQEDFFSSFGYTPPMGASAGTATGMSGNNGLVVGAAIGSSALSPIPRFAGSASSNAAVRSPRWGPPPVSRDRSPPLRRHDLRGSDEAGGGVRRGRPGFAGSGERRDGGSGGGGGERMGLERGGVRAGGAAAAGRGGVGYAFPASSDERGSPRRWRSLSPSASVSSPSRSGWSRGMRGAG